MQYGMFTNPSIFEQTVACHMYEPCFYRPKWIGRLRASSLKVPYLGRKDSFSLLKAGAADILHTGNQGLVRPQILLINQHKELIMCRITWFCHYVNPGRRQVLDAIRLADLTSRGSALTPSGLIFPVMETSGPVSQVKSGKYGYVSTARALINGLPL